MCKCVNHHQMSKCLCVCVKEGKEGEECLKLSYNIHYLSIITSNSRHIVLYHSLNYPSCFTYVFVPLFIYYYLLIFFTLYFAMSTCMLILHRTKHWKFEKKLKSIDDAIFLIISKGLFNKSYLYMRFDFQHIYARLILVNCNM